MKKFKLSAACALTASASLLFSSCIGSFNLTNQVLEWNKTVGSKTVNELVFIAFWILPVYEVSALADLIVLNSIEFWTGKNAVTASVKTVETENGRYLIACNEKGYKIINESTGEVTILNFDEASRTWSVEINGENLPFLTFEDSNNIRVLTPGGEYRNIDLSCHQLMAIR